MLLKRFNSMATALQCLTVCLSCLKGQAAPTIELNPPPTVNQASNAPAGVPDFVIRHAPIVFLDPNEKFFPADLSDFIAKSTPKGDKRAAIANLPSPLNLDNLDLLNSFSSDKGKSVYITSNDDPDTAPEWIKGVRPDGNGKTNDAITSAIIVADKGNGRVDAFYFYWQSFNYGGEVFGKNLGNHVGDWEHNMIRFQNGKPEAMWYSQHSKGQAFKFSAVLKDSAGLRPIVFCADGSHALYGLPGHHDYTIGSFIPGLNLPGQGLLDDETGYGALWDPIKSAYWYTYTAKTSNTQDSAPTRYDSQVGTFKAYDPSTSPVGWLYFQGRWGDQQLPDNDPRQDDLFGNKRYTTGPNGPAYKNLVRNNVYPGGSGAVSPILLPRMVGRRRR